MENKTNPIKLFISESWLLIVAALCFGLLLSGVNYALKPRIEANLQERQTRALRTLLFAAEKFETVLEQSEISDLSELVTVYRGIKDDQCVGWVFTATGAGYADKIDLFIAVESDFEKIIGYNVIFSNETVGFGDRIYDDFFKDQFVSAPVEQLRLEKSGDAAKIDNTIIAITGATVSSQAVVDIFNKFMLPVRDYLLEKGLIE